MRRRPIPVTREAGKTRPQRRLLGTQPKNPGFGFGPTQWKLPTFRDGRVSGTRDEDEDDPEEAEKTGSGVEGAKSTLTNNVILDGRVSGTKDEDEDE